MGECERVLIADVNQQRMKLLKGLFEQEFSEVEFIHVQTFQEVQQQAGTNTWKMILFSSKLPYSSENNSAILQYYFSELNQIPSVLVCLFGENGMPELHESFQGRKFLYVPAIESSFSQERRKLTSEFRQCLNWSPPLPEIILEDHPLLHEQVRSLHENRKLDAGKALLAQLVRGFFVCDKANVARLGQGKSGSRVFRIRPEPCSAANPEFVLKLVEKRDNWKIRSEITGHQKAREFLAQPFRQHITYLCQTCSPKASPLPDMFEHVTSTSADTWQAICYGFLGGERLGQFVDLESVLIAESSKLSKKVSSVKKPNQQFAFTPSEIRADRQAMLGKILEWLRGQWYDLAQANQETKQLWETTDAQPEYYSALPPYRFTSKAKERIIAFLDSFDAQLGERFSLPVSPPNWGERVALIRELLSKDGEATNFSKMDTPLNFLLSPAHGDLNAANILLWLEQREHFFLIDFPFYQEWGHAVQDFARLEVEMKFMLLDRQADSPASELPAFDYTPSQMALWLELEEHLLNDWKLPKPQEQNWQQQGHKMNVICCLELIQLIRNTVEDVYRQAGAANNFSDEYWAALLYHTLRVLGYPTVSIFKRLFAIYSASSLLTKLK